MWNCFAAKTVFNSFIRRAGAILKLPFVKEHLAILIKEREALNAKYVKMAYCLLIENYFNTLIGILLKQCTLY